MKQASLMAQHEWMRNSAANCSTREISLSVDGRSLHDCVRIHISINIFVSLFLFFSDERGRSQWQRERAFLLARMNRWTETGPRSSFIWILASHRRWFFLKSFNVWQAWEVKTHVGCRSEELNVHENRRQQFKIFLNQWRFENYSFRFICHQWWWSESESDSEAVIWFHSCRCPPLLVSFCQPRGKRTKIILTGYFITHSSQWSLILSRLATDIVRSYSICELFEAFLRSLIINDRLCWTCFCLQGYLWEHSVISLSLSLSSDIRAMATARRSWWNMPSEVQ